MRNKKLVIRNEKGVEARPAFLILEELYDFNGDRQVGS